jgi:DNA-binding FadR family transcriptional regulator
VALNEYPFSLKQQLRQPRLAELVAAVLRDRIVSGELEDGAMLPKQEDLLAEFRISPPPMREALRILETEGLITVRRGNTGGAIVHRPQPGKAAYMMGLVLQSRAVPLSDVIDALKKLEPVCAAGCAARDDRAESVLPRLRANMDEAAAAIEDPNEYARLARQFHAELVDCCGNETLILMVGALESLWSAHVDKLARTPERLGSFADKDVRVQSSREHEELYVAIEAGDVAAAEKAMLGEIERLATAGPTAAELARARGQVLGGSLFGGEGATGIANQVGVSWALTGKPRSFQGDQAAVRKVTAATIKKAAASYLSRGAATVVVANPGGAK